MPINSDDLKNLVVIPALEHISLNSDEAVSLILGTGAKESHLGTYLKQIKGPAMGIYQMEMTTHDDIYENFLKYHPVLEERVKELLIKYLSFEDNLKGNLFYATAMCRLQYRRVKESLPLVGDIRGQAAYWKKYYNTESGKGTIEEFMESYYCYVK